MAESDHDRLFIGGEWVKPAGADVLEVISPSTEEIVGRVPATTTADIDLAVATARRAFDDGPWPRLSVEERSEYVGRLAELLAPQAEELARVQVDEMGSPISWMRAVTIGSIGYKIDVARENAQQLKLEEVRDGKSGSTLVLREPVGVVAAITPWNGPIANLITKLLPPLLTGCTIVLKPPPEAPLDGYYLGQAIIDAGIPPGVVSIVAADREVGEHLVRHPGVDKVAFTGSTAAGRRIGSICGQMMKRVTLELGGKSAAILMEDVDLDLALSTLMVGTFQNTGQICAALTRVLVPRSRYEEMSDRFCDATTSLKVGNPYNEETSIGPLVAERQRDRVEGYIRSGLAEGAKIALGGGRPGDQKTGWFVEPTVFVDVDNSMRIAQEEIFGPVACLIPYSTEDEAIAIANDSEYGLSGAVFTSDIDSGIRVAKAVRTGTFSINGFKMSLEAPFGGRKQSGIGRENGKEAFDAYLEFKSVSLP
jgi:aldehyde dehydrogenase (NAD+)